MIPALILALLFPAPTQKELSILFLGNSHTASSNLPGMVESLLEADGSGRKVTVKVVSGAFLNDIAENPEARKEVSDGHGIVVLQGAMLSSSHKFTYSQKGALALAKLAKKAGSRAVFFAEWPRQNWDETGYILGIYRPLAKAAGAEIAATCKAWDIVLKARPKLGMWAGDGNHASLTGSYLAACTIYYRIVGPGGKIGWAPNGFDRGLVADFAKAAKTATATP